MRIFRTCLKLSIKKFLTRMAKILNSKNWAPIRSRQQDWIPDYKYDIRRISPENPGPGSLSVDACLRWRKSRNQSTQSYMIYRNITKTDIWWIGLQKNQKSRTILPIDLSSDLLIVCRKLGSVYCLRGSKTNLFGLPFVWDSVRQFNCVSDRYSYQSFSRDEIDLKWSSQV